MAEKDLLPEEGNTIAENAKNIESSDNKKDSKEKNELKSHEQKKKKPKTKKVTKPNKETPETANSDLASSEPILEAVEEKNKEEKEEHEDHTADYNEKSEEELLIEVQRILKDIPINSARIPILAIKSVLSPRWDNERSEAQDKYIESGGNIIDFHFEQKNKEDFYQVFNEFKKLYSEYRNQLQGKMVINLELKKNLLSEIKKLAESDDLPTGQTYKEFKRINDRWKEIGHVPNDATRDLYASYRFFVDRFYDNLRLSHDLRDLDHKHNKEVKLNLIAEIKSLAEKDWTAALGKELQRLHASWKEVGPVSLEEKEILWNSFQEGSNILHEKRRLKQEAATANNKERLSLKEKIVEELENLAADQCSDHKQWQNSTDKAKELRESMSKIGRTFSTASDLLWDRFKKSEKLYFKNRNQFYKGKKAALKVALEDKYQLVVKAEELSVRTDWTVAVKEVKKLQEDWKKTGFVPRKDSDKVWLKFKSACNKFFESMRSANGEMRVAQRAENNRNNKLSNALSNLEKAKRDLSQLENNMGFFQFANADSPIVKDAQKKVDEAKKIVEKAEKHLKETRIAQRKEDNDKAIAEKPSEIEENSNEE
ncbi:MAG: DUF349 domain-containing protein [Schleiferiaceae bacterium]|nr:DUF349 domain-containing protein [Schleiferiaceae bacterium]